MYQEIGTTNFENINMYIETRSVFQDQASVQVIAQSADASPQHLVFVLGLLSILCGCMFKVSAAPFHS